MTGTREPDNSFNGYRPIGGFHGGSDCGLTAPTSSDPVNGDDADPKDSDCEGTAGNPVVLSTGNKIEPEPEHDFAASSEVPLWLSRTYNHYWAGAGLFGKHWVSNLDYMLTFGSTALNTCFPRPGGGVCGIGANTVIYA